jgi:hypothetical protein
MSINTRINSQWQLNMQEDLLLCSLWKWFLGESMISLAGSYRQMNTLDSLRHIDNYEDFEPECY